MITKKLLSSAVLFTDKQRFLTVHPTNKNTNLLDIPKGEIDKGETPIETAIREFKEETSISLNKNNLHYIGKFYLHEHKDIYLFLYIIDKLPPITSLKCSSMTKAYGKPIEEIDKFVYLNLFDYKKLRKELHNPIITTIMKNNLMEI